MAPPPASPEAFIKDSAVPPPPGMPLGVPIPGTEKPNRTPIYRHWRYRDQPLLTTIEPVQSVHDLMELSFQKNGPRRCLGLRNWNPATRTWEDKYEWITYAELAQRRKNAGAGIVEAAQLAGVTKDKFGVGIWSQNRPEWHITDIAAASQSLFTVSLYDTLGPDTTEYIINHAELPVVAVSSNHIPTLLNIAPRLPSLKVIISYDALDNGEQAGRSKGALLNQIASQHGIKIYDLTEIEQLGAKSGRPFRPPTWTDLSTINYTSGTTGPPKGVVMTQGNAVSGINSARMLGNIERGDLHLSYMPLAHIYGRVVDQVVLVSGAAIGFFRGDVTGLVDDLKVLKPNAFISVPRLFNRFNSAIRTATVEAPGFKGALSRHVVETKKASMRLPMGQAHNRHFLYDRIWTRKVRAAVGLDNARAMISASAQLDPEIQTFLGAAFGNDFIQGYGMTETYAAGTVQLIGDYSTGNLGPPMAGIEMCLESVPDYNYSVDDKPNPRGEVLFRGPSMFQGYYKNEEENKKAIEADGWFHSGDIAEFDKNGCIKIIDRKKNVLKLAQGEYISPERIENVYLSNTALLATAYVHGDPTESNLVGVFGVDPENFAPFASKITGKTLTMEDHSAINAAANDPKVKAEILKVLDKIGRTQKFNSYERVRNVHLSVEPFSIENGIFTPTLKLKRPQAAKAFRKEIDRMYAEIKSVGEVNKLKL